MYRSVLSSTLGASVRRFSAASISASKASKESGLEKALEELAEIKIISSKEIPKHDKETLATSKLIDTFSTYNPKTLTEETIAPNSKSPVPISAELNYYAPLKHEVTHGDLKAEVIFKCFDPVNVEFFCDFALRAAYYLGLPATGPKPIQVKRERWTVIRAPFVHAKSKENFERKTHGRIIKIWDSDNEIVDLWLAYLKKNSVWGVGVKVNMYTQEPLNISENMAKLEGSEQSLSDLKSSIETLSNDTTNPVSQKVLELLKDPVFARHLSADEASQIESKPQSIEK
ncbi:mitochondrial 37S ribosomal protein rsm10 [Pichia californica]|uniref:Small ribosomal subunit protein uS10m n=1 Tax=Pichia californica TaxID=460514 RepID=A0A9P6WPI1_9ASCO|nr:mitochondrial 37S ribosomal protein rsm10 [[Candida] californica]KAG0690915.1 mitochondrial 37S ribosomal protein rsm10 [[Candida] californica]